jgi:hypothetical protein
VRACHESEALGADLDTSARRGGLTRPLCKILTVVDDVRVTVAVAAVLRIFLEEPTAPRYGYDLMNKSGFPSGKLYPILARLRKAGWLDSEMESIDPTIEGRPRRRWYRITADGVAKARVELALLHQQTAVPSWRRPGKPKTVGGTA